MADFQQTGPITTLHRLRTDRDLLLEHELERSGLGIGLVLPALYSEFETPAMPRIIEELAEVRYLRHIVVSLDRATRAEYERARWYFRDVPTPVTVLWNDGETIRGVLSAIEDGGLPLGAQGKGRGCWLATGYLLARGDCDVIAYQDCDIVDYDRSLLARLCYPLAAPCLDFDFCKGYYARTNHRMNGRVTRLYIAPLLRALDRILPGAAFLDFFRAFRYPLAGEFAIRTALARKVRVPCDWGLEIGMLAEVYRNRAPSRVCQSDLADAYEHKHQPLSPDDPTRGLRRMAAEIAVSLFRTLAADGAVLGPDHFRTLEVAYVRSAEDMVESYAADALLNGLDFGRSAEESAVGAFVHSLRDAAAQFLADPLGSQPLASWERVICAVPGIRQLLLEPAGEFEEAAAVA